jgi:hypothetical protein
MGNDHQPDRYGDGQIDLAPKFPNAQDANKGRREFSERNPGEHAKRNPQAQAAFEEIQLFGRVRRRWGGRRNRMRHRWLPI